jgi:hypothetical protein
MVYDSSLNGLIEFRAHSSLSYLHVSKSKLGAWINFELDL